jgi:hypothetical protein
MAKSTGPIIAAGGLTLLNQTVLGNDPGDDIFEIGARIGIATGILAMMFYGIEKVSPELAVGLAWTGLVTTLFVRYNNKPTVMERAVDLFD